MWIQHRLAWQNSVVQFWVYFVSAFLLSWMGYLASLWFATTDAGRGGGTAGVGAHMVTVMYIVMLVHDNGSSTMSDTTVQCVTGAFLAGIIMVIYGVGMYVLSLHRDTNVDELCGTHDVYKV